MDSKVYAEFFLLLIDVDFMRKNSFLSFILSLLLPISLFSQERSPQMQIPDGAGIVMGSVVDVNLQPLQYSMVYIYQLPDSLSKGMMVSDENGRFSFNPVEYGNYYLEVNVMGYERQRTTSFVISQENPVHRLFRYKMETKMEVLQTVTITAQKPMLSANLDKKVFTVDGNIAADGATAVEVLQDIPSVDVDLEGNVTLRGSENVTILVDGRPTNLTLEQIPAAQIESIEVITNPSARLEPDGMAGILNVVLKKKKESGFNGMVSIGGGMTLFQNKAYFENFNGNVNLNYTYNKINIFLNYNVRKYGRHGAGTMERTSWFNADSSFLYQDNASDNSGYYHSFRGGLDWYINKQNTLSFAFGGNLGNRTSENEIFSDNAKLYNTEKYPYMTYDQLGKNTNGNNHFNGNVNYKKEFKVKGRELVADLYYSQMKRSDIDKMQQIFSIPDSTPNYFQRTENASLSRNATAQVDFVTPVGNGGRIETGYKYALRITGQDYSLFDGHVEEELVVDSTQINDFLYTEHINAAYFIYSNSFWNKLKVQAGLRAELANTSSDLRSSDTVVYNNYLNFFPTLHVRYEPTEKHNLQFSYSRRVTRPRVNQLNPFVDISDKLNLRVGNPKLEPEFVNSLELSYLFFYDGGSVTGTAFYRQRNNIITRYTQIYEGIDEEGMTYTYTLTSYENLEKSQNFGFEVVYSARINKFWRFNLNGDFYRVIINSDDLIDENLSRDWAWGFRLNQYFTFPKNWDAQLNFRFRSASLTTGSMGWGTGGVGQGRRSPSYSLGLSVRKSFFDKKFTVSLNIRDLIYRKNTVVHTYSFEDDQGYDATSTRTNSQFQAYLTLSYKINNFKQRRSQMRDESSDDEMMDG